MERRHPDRLRNRKLGRLQERKGGSTVRQTWPCRRWPTTLCVCVRWRSVWAGEDFTLCMRSAALPSFPKKLPLMFSAPTASDCQVLQENTHFRVDEHKQLVKRSPNSVAWITALIESACFWNLWVLRTVRFIQCTTAGLLFETPRAIVGPVATPCRRSSFTRSPRMATRLFRTKTLSPSVRCADKQPYMSCQPACH